MVTKKKKIKISGLKSEEVYHPWIKRKYRQISDVIAKRLINTSVIPNHVSVLGFLILGLSAYFFFRADYTSLIIAGILLQVGYLFDFIDGSLARMKNLASNYGRWVDFLSGTYGWILIYLGATLGVYSQIQKPYILVFGLLASIGTLTKNLTQTSYLTTFKFAYKFGQEKYRKMGFVMFFRPTGPFVYTVFTLGAFLNKIYWVLMLFGAYLPLYTIAQNTLFTLRARKSYLKEKKTSVKSSRKLA